MTTLLIVHNDYFDAILREKTPCVQCTTVPSLHNMAHQLRHYILFHQNKKTIVLGRSVKLNLNHDSGDKGGGVDGVTGVPRIKRRI